MQTLSLSNLPAGITVMGTLGFHGWQTPRPLPGSDGKEFPATGTHLFYPAITFLFHFISLFFVFVFLILESPSSPVICFPSVHADGATKRSQEVWCTQIPLDSVCSLYHRAVGERNEKLEAIF